MDSDYVDLNNFLNGFDPDDDSNISNSYQDLNPFKDLDSEYIYPDDLKFLNSTLDIPPSPDPATFFPPFSVSAYGGSSSVSQGLNSEEKSMSNSEDNDFSDSVLNYISQMLMEENVEEQQPSVVHDPLALKDTEKSLYDVLGKKYPSSPGQFQYFIDNGEESPDSHFSFNANDFARNASFSTSSTNNSNDSQCRGDGGDCAPSVLPEASSDNHVSEPHIMPPARTLAKPLDNFASNSKAGFSPKIDSLLLQNMFSDKESVRLFQQGMEEANKFLPDSSKLILDLGMGLMPVERNRVIPDVLDDASKGERYSSLNKSRGRKNHEREDTYLEERSNKQLALNPEDENELSELLDKVLLCKECVDGPNDKSDQNKASKTEKQINQQSESDGGKSHSKRKGMIKETVDLRTLLIQCAQSVSSDDRRTANELLKQIRVHSSPLGDGSQRMAHYFANALQARLNGSETGFQNFHMAQTFKRTTTKDLLKAYEIHFSVCPFKRFSIFFANKMILKVAAKARVLHIIDFGITYGFQWPLLIQLLSLRPEGPPKLRITGIELPQCGFRPAQCIDETGRRLERYCARFNVQFEYNGIASQKWETIRIEDLKVRSGEVLAVNCLYRFRNLLDETVVVNSPKDAILKLIRSLNPNVFVHAIINGSYNVPFFVTRFREALYHYSAMFDMFDTNVSRASDERLMFEREFYGREIMNAIACEGPERVERPETYKQWQVRYYRAGFKKMQLDQELMDAFRAKLKEWYKKDFVFDEDNDWMLLGWRGRILFASSCWVPA